MAGSRDLEDCSHPSGTVPRDPPACCLLRRQQTEHTAELDRALGSLFPPLPSTEGNSLRDHVICIRSPSQGGRELGSKLSCFLIQSGCPEPEVLKLEKASTCPGGLWKQKWPGTLSRVPASGLMLLGRGPPRRTTVWEQSCQS